MENPKPDTQEAPQERPSWFSRLDLSHCQERFDETEAFAKSAGKLDNLHSKLSRLCHGYGCFTTGGHCIPGPHCEARRESADSLPIYPAYRDVYGGDDDD